jgi:hypothetical protein
VLVLDVAYIHFKGWWNTGAQIRAYLNPIDLLSLKMDQQQVAANIKR